MIMCRARREAVTQAHAAVLKHGGITWQQLGRFSAPTQTTCSRLFTKECKSGSQSQSSAFVLQFTKNANGTTVPLPQPEMDLATFLMIRGDYSWIGYGWSGCCNGLANCPGNKDG